MKKVFIILTILISSICCFSQDTNILYDYNKKDYYIEIDSFQEKMIPENVRSWTDPIEENIILPTELQPQSITKENEFYNIGIVFYNQGVKSFIESHKTKNEKLKDNYNFYWKISSQFLEKYYEMNKNKESLIVLKHIYARLNDVQNYKKTIERIK